MKYDIPDHNVVPFENQSVPKVSTNHKAALNSPGGHCRFQANESRFLSVPDTYFTVPRHRGHGSRGVDTARRGGQGVEMKARRRRARLDTGSRRRCIWTQDFQIHGTVDTGCPVHSAPPPHTHTPKWCRESFQGDLEQQVR